MADAHMSREEREAFLADVHVGVLSVENPGQGPHALPIWYQYLDGVVLIRVDKDSVKARLVRAAGRASLTVQSEVAPYKYVSVEGPAVVDTRALDDLAMAVRYLGPEIGKWYAENNAAGDAGAVIVLTPERWRTYDFAKLF
jgi:nitroimidazol reductase NimA-like FMN-containing flavoprotein (pyridoxamine 5'-phosphate oxidase superfamily)